MTVMEVVGRYSVKNEWTEESGKKRGARWRFSRDRRDLQNVRRRLSRLIAGGHLLRKNAVVATIRACHVDLQQVY